MVSGSPSGNSCRLRISTHMHLPSSNASSMLFKQGAVSCETTPIFCSSLSCTRSSGSSVMLVTTSRTARWGVSTSMANTSSYVGGHTVAMVTVRNAWSALSLHVEQLLIIIIIAIKHNANICTHEQAALMKICSFSSALDYELTNTSCPLSVAIVTHLTHS